MAWCALVALALARQDGGVRSPAQENLFLTRWLATALKQRRFSRDVTPDIEWLLKQGRQLGVSAKLVSKLNYLWRSCTGELSEQNDLFRLTYALETAKDMHWQYRLLTAKRDAASALRFFRKAIRYHCEPEVVTIDKSGANTADLATLNMGKPEAETMTIRQSKYLNNLIEQDHRNIKRRIRPMLGFKSFRRAQTLLAGVELIHMIRKGQCMHPKSQGLSPADSFYRLAA
ncbi:DUF2913 family protein [Salmonella enterica]|nr:DUF2913 family protein [Salmonella enterica]